MELLWMPVLGAAVGAVLRYVIPGRATHGILLLPALGACTTAVAWVVMVVSGWSLADPWIWLLALVAPVVTCTIAALALARVRPARDEQRLQHLLATR
ncbi:MULTISPECIES: hypothetical protein [unclassified Agrococcus]|uniref:hypothetical protein n=1 Tax=unclassified Agrococcus TaxID=2615065 RepID=UPI003619C6D3